MMKDLCRTVNRGEVTGTPTLGGNRVVQVKVLVETHLLHYSFARASRRICRKFSSKVQVISYHLAGQSVESLLVEAVLLDRA